MLNRVELWIFMGKTDVAINSMLIAMLLAVQIGTLTLYIHRVMTLPPPATADDIFVVMLASGVIMLILALIP